METPSLCVGFDHSAQGHEVNLLQARVRFAVRVAQILTAAIFLSVPFGLSQDLEQQIHDHYAKAQKAMLESRLEEAEREYLAILKLNPTLAEAYANLGIVYYLEFKYRLAAQALQKALERRPGLSRARLYLGLSQWYVGAYQDSIRSLEEALAGELDSPYRKLARTNQARDYLALDQDEKAVAILKPLVEEYPQDADILFTLGKAYLRLSAAAAEKLALAGDRARVHQMLAENFVNQGKFKEAIDEYDAAFALDRDLPGVHYPLALMLLHEGKSEDGQRNLEAALLDDPQNERARRLLEQSRAGSLSKSAIEEALSSPAPGTKSTAAGFIDPLPAMPGSGAHNAARSPLEMAQLLYRQGQYDAAAGAFEKLALHNPRDADALYWLVKAYQALSVRAFDQIGQAAPDSARAHQLLAEGFDKQERFDPAVEEYQRSLEKDPRLPGIHYAIGLDRMKMGQWDEARKEFDTELTLDPFNAGANFRLGQLAYRATKYDEARGYFSRAVEIFPAFGEARAQLGQAFIKERRYKEAIPHLLAATELIPDDHTVHFQLYHAYRALGEKDRAQKELETFQRMENQKKEVTLHKAAQSMELIQKARKEKLEPVDPGSTLTPSPPP